MDKEKFKILLIQKIIECSDTDVLKKIEKILDENGSEVKEGMEEYKIFTQHKDSVLTDEQIEEVDRRYQKYLRGEGKSYAWEEVEEEIQRKNEL